jgi:hypothetical protein
VSDGPVPSDDESKRVSIVASEERGECARHQRSLVGLELVQTDQGGASELAPPLLENGSGSADVRAVDEHRLSIAAKESLGRRRPGDVGDLDQIAEHAWRHPRLSQLLT